MKPTVQLNISQQLTLTPQLQQAIRLLQLSTLDLQQEIQNVLQDNPMLELSDEDNFGTKLEKKADDSLLSLEFEKEQIPRELPIDTGWEDAMQIQGSKYKSLSQDLDFSMEAQHSEIKTLHDHLLWQVNLTTLSETDQVIAMTIIDAIDDDGFLTSSIEEITDCLMEKDLDDPNLAIVDKDEVLAVLGTLQNLDPVGVCARSLNECLLLQLKSLPKTVAVNRAINLIMNHFEILIKKDYKKLMQLLDCDENTLKQTISLIQSLNPKPGQSVAESKTDYVIPDIVVNKIDDSWLVKLNGEALPKININRVYSNLLNNYERNADYTYMQNQMQEAKWFMKSLQSRNETLLRVAQAIFSKQQDFLENGDIAMKPLILQDIAQEIGMHESTISRVTTQKYALTPRGVFELKYFFSSHVNTNDGGECSSTAIRAHIKKLIAEENPRKPLSDAKIAYFLKINGINVARRTIAKYRESMNIAPSNERKSLA